jgi:hypothetical protein
VDDDVTRIEIPELLALGADVTGIGARFAEAVAGIDGWEQSARGAVAGSAGCAQLGDSARDWRSTLTLLATSIQEFGRSLGTTAAEFRTADVEAGRRVHRSGGAVPR